MNLSTKALTEISQIILIDLGKQLTSDKLTAHEIEQTLRSSLQTIGQKTYGALLSHLDEQAHGVRAVCQCGWFGQRVAKRPAQVLSVFGWAHYRRSCYQCRRCQQRWVALDENQGLQPGQATQAMRSLLGIAGVTVSFEEARRHIAHFLNVTVSANTIRHATQTIGEQQAAQEQAWIAQSQDGEYLQARARQPAGPARLYGSIDGAMVPLLNEWREAKTVCWYQVQPRYGHPEEWQAQDIVYATSLEPAEDFAPLVWGTGVQQQADQATELIFVCDGAAWIWQMVSHYFPSAVQIVDWFHACQYLYAVAETLALERPAAQAWLTQMLTYLWEGDIETILTLCQPLVGPGNPPVERLLTYYTNNLARLRYADFRSQGYFIGSGTVESACKQIVSLRLKRAGARWSQPGAALTAKARTAWLNQTWHKVTALPLAA